MFNPASQLRSHFAETLSSCCLNTTYVLTDLREKGESAGQEDSIGQEDNYETYETVTTPVSSPVYPEYLELEKSDNYETVTRPVSSPEYPEYLEPMEM